MYQMKLGTCEKLFIYLQRENLEELQKRKYHSEKQSTSDSSDPELKEVFERCLDVDSGKVVFKCLYCEFQSICLENMTDHINDNTHGAGSEMVQCHTYGKTKTQKRICGLCLEACDNFKDIGGKMKDVLDTVLPNMDPAALEGRVVCTHCMEMLMKCLDFKEACLYTYNNIISFVNNKDNVKLNLKDIYLSKNQNCAGIPEDEVVCGFCMCSVKNCSAISLDVEGDAMLQIMMPRCLPELDLSLIEKPVVCDSCHDSLENCFGFMTNCLAVEDKVQKWNGNLVGIIKEDKPICEEKENAVDRKIDNEVVIFKSEPMFCVDSDGATERESVKLEKIDIKEENLFERNNERIDLKTNEQDFIDNEVESFKSEPLFCIDNKRATEEEGKKLEINFKEERLFEMDNERIDTKTNEQDITDNEVHVFKSEPSFCIDNKSVTEEESKKLEINFKEERLFEMDNERIDTKTNEQDITDNEVHVFKSEPSFCIDNKSATEEESKKLETNIKEESLFELDNEEIDIKTDEPDFNRFEGGVAWPQPEDTNYSYQAKRKDQLEMHQLEHKSTSEIKMYTCDSCSFQTKYKYSLKVHLLQHRSPSEITIYKCDICSFQTNIRRNLKRHAEIHKSESEVTMYKCDACSYQTRHKSRFRSHLLLHKKQATMYKCKFCSFQTLSKCYFRKHKLVMAHKEVLDVPTYKCDICSFQTKIRHYLKKHAEIHKSESEVTMYKCDSCSYQAKCKSQLRPHVLLHKKQSTIHKCKFCSFQTLNTTHFRKHELIHMDSLDVPVYKCGSCSFSTKYKQNLGYHLLLHKTRSEVSM